MVSFVAFDVSGLTFARYIEDRSICYYLQNALCTQTHTCCVPCLVTLRRGYESEWAP